MIERDNFYFHFGTLRPSSKSTLSFQNNVYISFVGKLYMSKIVTDKKCYPVEYTEIKEDSRSRIDILEEIRYTTCLLIKMVLLFIFTLVPACFLIGK